MCRQAWVAFGAQGSQRGSLPYKKGTPLSKRVSSVVLVILVSSMEE